MSVAGRLAGVAWIKRASAVAAFLFALALVSRSAEAAQPAPPDAYVVVRLASGVTAEALRGPKATLEELGYRTLPVPPGVTTDAYLAKLRANPAVISAEATGLVRAAAGPNDPYYAQQASYLGNLGAPQAWDLTTGGAGTVTVAVLDSGTDLNHEDLKGRLWENPNDADNDGVDDDGNGCIDDRYGCRFVNLTATRQRACGYTSSVPTGDVMDDHGTKGSTSHSHGTMVAGIVAAAGNNGLGMTGVAWNVRIMTVKVLDCGPFGGPEGDVANVAQGIQYARRMGANVINLSLATARDEEVLRSAIAAAQADGIIVVAAAGNIDPGSTNVGPGYPAAYTEFPNVIAVGATDTSGNWAPYSRYGPAVDFAAPGSNVIGTLRSDIATNPYGRDDRGGTSFATPIVSGMFALLMSRNSRLTAADYIAAARAAASPAPPAPHGQNWAGSGIVNIGGAVARLPATISGAALKDWKDVPTGTEVRAVVGGAECGTTTSVSIGQTARYGLRVPSDVEKPGCGAAGRTIELFVGGLPAQPKIPWAERDKDLGMVNVDISSVSPPPGAIVVQTLNGHWSNIAHLEPPAPLPGALANFTGQWTAVLKWNATKPFLEALGAFDRYVRQAPGYVNDLPKLERYDAIWIDGGAANIALPNPGLPVNRKINLQPGWNNFVYTGSAKSVAQALGEVEGKFDQVVQFDNGAEQWRSYLPGQARYLNDFGGLFPLQVYWVHMKAPGTITMD